MTTYYFDASALSKRYVQEVGTAWVRTLTAPEVGHTLLTSRITMVEIYSALARRKREGAVPAADCLIAAEAFTGHSATEYEFVELGLDIVQLSRQLLDDHPLRAYDAVQLASALTANNALLASRLSPLVFISADERLNTVAVEQGLNIANPNHHP